MSVKDYIDGLMLSDGNLRISSSISGCYHQVCKNRQWLEIISNDLYEYGIINSIDDGIISSKGFGKGKIYYNLYANSSPFFKEMYERWYKKWYDVDNYNRRFWHFDEGSGDYFVWKKIIPKDIKLSPECVANEYLGDGSIGTVYSSVIKVHRLYQIKLSTYCFSSEDVEYLSNSLNFCLDIKSKVDSRNAVLISNKHDISEFLNYIKDYKVDCYSYKFPKEVMQ